jgi:hypothetical protein
MDEKLAQEAECWIFMYVWRNSGVIRSDKLAGWNVITKMLIPAILVGLTLIWIVLKLLCCILCSKAKVAENKEKKE